MSKILTSQLVYKTILVQYATCKSVMWELEAFGAENRLFKSVRDISYPAVKF